MIVGLCYTKNNKNAVAALKALEQGIKKCGDEAIPIFSLDDRQYFDQCSVLIQVGEYSKFIDKGDPQNNLRLVVKEHCNRTQKNRLIVEPGLFSAVNNRFDDDNLENRYFQIAANYIKSRGLWNTGCKNARWDELKSKFNIKVHPWKWDRAAPIVILGQNHRGTSVQDIDVLDVHKKVIRKLRDFEKFTNEIIYLAHPNQVKLPNNLAENNVQLRRCKSWQELHEILLKSWFAVAHTTNASVDAILCGIPLLRTSAHNITASYNIAHMYINDLYHNYEENRNKFLWDCAANQFSLDEMKWGIFWEIFKKIWFALD